MTQTTQLQHWQKRLHLMMYGLYLHGYATVVGPLPWVRLMTPGNNCRRVGLVLANLSCFGAVNVYLGGLLYRDGEEVQLSK